MRCWRRGTSGIKEERSGSSGEESTTRSGFHNALAALKSFWKLSPSFGLWSAERERYSPMVVGACPLPPPTFLIGLADSSSARAVHCPNYSSLPPAPPTDGAREASDSAGSLYATTRLCAGRGRGWQSGEKRPLRGSPSAGGRGRVRAGCPGSGALCGRERDPDSTEFLFSVYTCYECKKVEENDRS